MAREGQGYPRWWRDMMMMMMMMTTLGYKNVYVFLFFRKGSNYRSVWARDGLREKK